MLEFYPLFVVGTAVTLFAIAFLLAFVFMKEKKEAIGFERNMKDGYLIKKLMKYAKPQTKSFVLAFAIMILSIGYDLASPLIVGYIEELLADEFELSKLFAMVAVYGLALIISLGCVYVQSLILQKAGQKIITALRLDTFEHIEQLSHSQLHKIPTGKLVTRVTNDTNAISFMFTNVFVNLAKNALVIVGVLAAMFCVNKFLTLVALCFTPFIVFFTLIFRKFSRKAFRKVKDGTTDINTFLSENLSGMKIIQIFNREETKQDEFEVKNRKLCRAKKLEILVFSVFRPVIYMLYISSIMALLYFCGRGYIKGTSVFGQSIDSGTLVTFYMYIGTFFNPIQSLAEQFNFLQSAFASAEKIFTILEIEPEIRDIEGAEDVDKINGDIEFRNVWFAYEEENWVIKDLSFTVKAGETIALVGATGSGKTTILSLLCRNYDIQKGQILIDGKDIKSYKIDSLRRQFGQMLQDVFLFSGTVRSNIVLRDDTLTDEEVREACRYVNADKFIDKLDKGLDYEVRERGNNFSTGQRQLISFARTILKKPSVMILDEATANIDTETELLIQDSLNKMMNIGTMLIVAHRLSTIKCADRILVMSNGCKIEEGSHEELMALGGRYRDLYLMQSSINALNQGEQPA